MNRKSLYLFATFLLCIVLPAAAQGQPKPPGALDNPVVQLLLAIIIGLLIAIAVLANAVIGAMDIYRERMKKGGGGAAAMATGIIITGLLLSNTGMAQEAQAQTAVAATTISGMSPVSFYLLVSVISLELLVIFALLWMLRHLVGIERKRKPKPAPAPGKPSISWWEKLNKTRTVDAASEQEQDMGHDFDGIRELNNPTPPWWKWGFYFSIGFAVIYLWVYHVSHSAPLQLEELAIAEAKAEAARQEYLANAANNIDENNVQLLTDAGDIASGQKLFAVNCTACHGAAGQGMVGPNLTDAYWLHGGKVNQVFSTIKYGVPEKGMKAWKDDFSPKQIAQLTSFIKTLQGTHPPDGKEPQGTME
ncbi:cbb3-type cytochrome c oxidase N-terminal domain-containing protein [Chitinophaga japonensis]|uniref:Cytochrome c oxidase cbb3-type subunit 3 n=1 Tax=Chitinophaga japonensis TaxID=104662 RepID=A0A562SS77_CHIJA|nr:cbb3-type cytochrome c oxidase N-terminal domain-containing protein [Chitinophaga japonensis]TWI84119.1 cytochrome c oxidase cbb3-type subunit 3 [Chitinophaga japonensis]